LMRVRHMIYLNAAILLNSDFWDAMAIRGMI
jgi:hypothetical protein